MERRPSVLSIAFLLVALAGVSFTAGALAKSGLKRGAQAEEVYKQLNPFMDALTLIQEKYVDEDKTDAKALLDGAQKGMIDTLDPFSQYMTADDYKDMRTETSGEFGGLGIEIAIRDERLTVVTPIDGTPADRAGIRAMDKILKIDGEKTDGLTINEAVKRLRGKVGTKVTVSIYREGMPQPFDVTLVRDRIKIESVRHYLLPGHIGYVRLSEFIHNSSEDVEAAFKAMEKEAPLKGLILDLRNDPGGLLEEAVKVSDLFVEKGKTIVSTKGRDVNQNYDYRATGRKKFAKRPVVVLVNEGSASASEIVAGALKDHKLGVLVGAKTFGKGSVQTIFPLENSGGAALRLTTAKYFTPSGVSIHGTGIEPDLDIKNPELSESTLKAYGDRMPEEFVKTLAKEKVEVGEEGQLPTEILGRFYAYCAGKNKKIDREELAKDAEILKTTLALELLRGGPGERAARRAAVYLDPQVKAAEEIVDNHGRLTVKWAAHQAKMRKEKAAKEAKEAKAGKKGSSKKADSKDEPESDPEDGK